MMNKILEAVNSVMDFKKVSTWIFWAVIFGISTFMDLHFYYGII